MVQAIYGGADRHMSMRPWVGYAVMGRQDMGMAYGMASMGIGMRAMGRLPMGVGVRGAWGACRGGRSPMAMAWGGGEWGPHTKESIRCIPQSGTLKNQKESLFRSHRSA